MEWTECLKKAIDYMEENLLNNISAEEVSAEVYMSSFYLQKGFKIMTGYSIAEYIRCRRLYMAALDVIAGKEKVIDLAYKYGYDTPESFTKAFTRFHGIAPKKIKGDTSKIKDFFLLKHHMRKFQNFGVNLLINVTQENILKKKKKSLKSVA